MVTSKRHDGISVMYHQRTRQRNETLQVRCKLLRLSSFLTQYLSVTRVQDQGNAVGARSRWERNVVRQRCNYASQV